MKVVKLSEIIIPKFHELFKLEDEVEDVIITSGRAGTKSSAIGIKGNYEVLSKDTAVVFMRKNKNKLRNTVHKESVRAFSRLGLNSNRVAKITTQPMQISIKKNGSTIYFAGSDNPDDTKGMIDDNFSISEVYIDEVTEFFKMGFDRGKEELENIKATFVRGNDESFRMYYMFNPPKNPNAPILKWLDEKKYMTDETGSRVLNPRTKHIHVTYLDVPEEWLGKRLIDSALETKRVDEDYYNWLWLGQSVGVENVIYHMFNRENHVIDYKGKRLYNIGIGIDYGQMNATTFNAFGLDRKTRVLTGIGGYKHSGRDSRFQKTPSDYAKDLYDFINEIENETKELVTFVVIDPSAKGVAEEMKRYLVQNGKGYVTFRAANNDVKEGIAKVQILLRNNMMTIDPKMKGAIEEFELYAYDPKSIERGDEKPIKDNDHDMDGIRYLVMEQWKYIKPFINDKEFERELKDED